MKVRGTIRNTSPILLLRAQYSKVIPTLFELDTNASQACFIIKVDSKLVHLELWDTSLHLNFDDKKPIPPSGTVSKQD